LGLERLSGLNNGRTWAADFAALFLASRFFCGFAEKLIVNPLVCQDLLAGYGEPLPRTTSLDLVPESLLRVVTVFDGAVFTLIDGHAWV
jgi:hypothetical protein